MSRAWTASSTPSSRDSTWNGKPAPSPYLHKQLDITACPKVVDRAGTLCYGLKSFNSSQAPGNEDLYPPGRRVVNPRSPGTRNEQLGPARPAFRIFIFLLALTG